MDTRKTRAWAEIDTDALTGNAAALKRLAAETAHDGDVMAVVKADGYGHGAVIAARAAARAGVAHFAVATTAEALELRAAGVRGEVYTLSSFVPDEAATLVRADVVPFVSSAEQAAALAAVGADAPLPARAFLVVDTGMGREGLLPDEAATLWRQTRTHAPGLRFTGIATHFSRADEPGIGDAVTAAQADAFFSFLSALGPDALRDADDGRGNRGLWLSLANSPGSLRLPHPPPPAGARGYLLRGGLALYGIEPYPEAYADLPAVRQALSWRARVTLVRDLPAGATVGYGQTHTLSRPSRVATLPVGYADGLSRKLSNRGVIIARGRRYPLIGRVSMDQCQVDVTDALPGGPIRVGEAVTLLGADGGASVSIREYSELVDTTPHEPPCAISKRVPRVYVGGGHDRGG